MMKLSKGKFQTILILAIVLAAYLLLAFVIPFAKTAVFWLALVFTLAAFGVQLYVLKLSFTKGKDARSKFYGFPIARIGVVYLIVQIALSFLFMAIAKICAAWIAVIVFVLMLAVAAVGIIAADAMRDEVERQDAQLKTDVAAMRALQSRAAALASRCEDAELKADAQKVEDGIEETLTYCDFPSEHRTRIRTNNVIERLNREIRRRTRVVGTFPDGNSALMLVCARLRHVAGTQWGDKKYINMKHLEAALDDASIAG